MFWTMRGCLCWLQDSDFLYLTGVDQQAVALIEASSPMRDANFTLYVPDTDPQVSPALLIPTPSSLLDTVVRKCPEHCIGLMSAL